MAFLIFESLLFPLKYPVFLQLWFNSKDHFLSCLWECDVFVVSTYETYLQAHPSLCAVWNRFAQGWLSYQKKLRDMVWAQAILTHHTWSEYIPIRGCLW